MYYSFLLEYFLEVCDDSVVGHLGWQLTYYLHLQRNVLKLNNTIYYCLVET